MKEIFVNNSLNLINSKYDYDSDTKDRIQYGLEAIYITISKLSVIFAVAFICGIFKETLIFAIFLNGLRTFAYGIHAKKSWHCYVSSLFSFILMPLIFKFIHINMYQKVLISILSLISIIVFAPADTYKRPLINRKQRLKLKFFSLLICVIYITVIFISKEEILNNLIILSMITETFLINPLIYKLFRLPYNNYKEYIKSGV